MEPHVSEYDDVDDNDDGNSIYVFSMTTVFLTFLTAKQVGQSDHK